MNKDAKKGDTVRRILRLLAPYKLLVAASIISAAVSVAGQLVIPILAGRAIDMMTPAQAIDMRKILDAAVQILIVAGISAAGQWFMGRANNRITYSVSRDLRDDAICKIQSLPLGYLDSHRTGDIISRITGDVDLFTDGLLMGFTQFFTGVLAIAGTLAFMFSVNVPIALVVVGVTPLSLVAAAFITKKSYRYFSEQNRARGEETAFVNERIEGMRVAQAFGHEAEDMAEFDGLNDGLSRVTLKAVFYSSITNPATRFVNGVVYAGVALAGALYAIGGGITIGQLSCFLTYANQYTKPFNEITGVVTEMQNAVSCAARVFELLDEADEAADAPGARMLGAGGADGRVDIRNVDFSYSKERELIRNMNLAVRPGERVAIVGPTGSGKTTLINLLMRFYDVDAGSIEVSGTDIRSITRKSLRGSFGMVLQDTWLKEGTVAENIAYGRPDATREEITAAAAAVRADGFIRRMSAGYDTQVGEGGDMMSQGQRQLISIARVMLCLPLMLILDEATSSIDTRTELMIQSAFSAMTEGRTSFIVAHRLSTVRNADVILVMDGGTIVEQGAHDELMAADGFYARLYNSQFEGVEI